MVHSGDIQPSSNEIAGAYTELLYPDAIWPDDAGKYVLATSIMVDMLDEYTEEHGRLPEGLEMVGLACAIMAAAAKRAEQFDRWIIGSGFDNTAAEVLQEMDAIIGGLGINWRRDG